MNLKRKFFQGLAAIALATVGVGAHAGTAAYYIYDEDGHVIGEYKTDGTPIQEHIYLDNRPVAVLQNGSTDYVSTDQLDTPRIITDSNKNVMWQWNSDPYGNGLPAGSLTYNLRFPGQYFDAETGKNYNMFRDYNPATGRYVESDPIGLAGGIDTYVYVNDNPNSNLDPSGKFCTSANGITTCSYPGGPTFRVPTPRGFPGYLGPLNTLYHNYDVQVATTCSNADALQALINDPSPGNPSPASAQGTPNIASVGFISNPIESYVTTDIKTGNSIVVNITTGSGFGDLSPGYVAREVSNGVVNNYGEGDAWQQSSRIFNGLTENLIDYLVWTSQTDKALSKCGCKH